MAKVHDVDMFPYCPSSDWDCPYYSKETDRCMMFEEENILPYNECDNFFDEDFADGDIVLMTYEIKEV